MECPVGGDGQGQGPALGVVVSVGEVALLAVVESKESVEDSPLKGEQPVDVGLTDGDDHHRQAVAAILDQFHHLPMRGSLHIDAIPAK